MPRYIVTALASASFNPRAGILVSGFISLSLTPMLCSRYLRPPHDQKHGRLYHFLGRCLDAMNRGYELSLGWVMRHHVTTMLASVGVLVATIYMFGRVPKGFIPSEDTGQILINTEAAQGVAVEQMVKNQQQLAAIVLKDPNVESFFSSVGVGGVALTGNTGRIFIKLKPRSERKLSAEEVIRALPLKTWPLKRVRRRPNSTTVLTSTGPLASRAVANSTPRARVARICQWRAARLRRKVRRLNIGNVKRET